jgi:hypothetical protein
LALVVMSLRIKTRKNLRSPMSGGRKFFSVLSAPSNLRAASQKFIFWS